MRSHGRVRVDGGFLPHQNCGCIAQRFIPVAEQRASPHARRVGAGAVVPPTGWQNRGCAAACVRHLSRCSPPAQLRAEVRSLPIPARPSFLAFELTEHAMEDPADIVRTLEH